MEENNTKRDRVSQTSAAEKIAGNEDLLSEILLRLPVRSLVRFKCVSKPWNLLISSSHLSHAHSRKNFGSLPVSGIIFPNGSRKFDFVGRPRFAPSLRFMKRSSVTMTQYCNGLMLCSALFNKKDHYYVCNPTTKKFSSIPLPTLEADPDSLLEFGINLVFDPSRSPHFEVVYFTGVIEPHYELYSTHLYSSNSQSWSSVESPVCPDRAFFHFDDADGFGVECPLDDGVLCNGSLYWLCSNQWKLLRFEVDEQRFTTITMNVDTNLIGERHKDVSIYLWQCKGKVCLVQEVVTSGVPADMVVYEMGNVCSEWLVKYMVKFPDAVSGLSTHDYDDCDENEEFSYTILAAFGGPKDDDDMWLLVKVEYNIRDSNVILYSIKEKTTTRMLFSGFEEEAQPYVESLSPVI